MEFQLTEEQRQIAATVRSAVEGGARSRPAFESDGAASGGDVDAWKMLATSGLLGLGIAEELGGSGGSLIDQTLVAHELGRVVSPAPFVSSAMVAGAVAQHLGDAALGTAVTSGRVVAVAFDRPGDRHLDTTGERATVSGRAPLVLDGAVADDLVLSVGDGDAVALVLVEAAVAEVASQASLDRGRAFATVDLDATPVRVLASGAPARTAIARATDLACVGFASEAAGVAERCLELATQHASTRRQFGEVIGMFQAIKHKLADGLVLVENARSAVLLGAWAVTDDSPDRALAVAAAKATATDNAVRVVADAMQVHGGIAITWEHDLHLYLRRAKTLQRVWGEPTDHRDRIAAALLAGARG
ncbi:MAG: acyl-CoA/acyl-ACP dehydrogenase [Actinobacteria bacterium]|nr:acyl-CoA/acyl-ACP dehydrogenase [Actinomycetota bacterium]